jgi:myo-inositol 2-dehydrogenase/D-chiro-inositol 1-dehydrogenase
VSETANPKLCHIMRRITIGLIGAGRIGKLHAEHLAWRIPDAELVAVADSRLEAAREVAAACGVDVAVEDYRVILENPAIEAVVICASTNMHAQMIEEAAIAGKHIFCEKPIDHDLAKIDKALAVVDSTGVKLQIGFMRRFDTNFRRVRDMVASGKIGTPHMLRIISCDPEPPPIEYIKVSGGIFLDMVIHDFDMARFLIGSEVSEIYATGAALVDPEIGKAGDIDTAATVLRFENGVIGTINNSRKAVYGHDQRVEVLGSGGMAATSNNMSDGTIYSNADSVHTAPPLWFFIERYTDAYIAEMIEFIECVREGKTPSVTGSDGRVPVIMAHAAKKSFEENRPVRLSEIDAG